MALRLIKELAGIIPYILWDGVVHTPVSYNHYLITPPRIYQEAIVALSKFYYDPGRDRLCIWAMLSTYHWPGWKIARYDFEADTGAYLGQSEVNAITNAWVNHAGLGSYGAIYCTWRSGYEITEVDASTLAAASGMWSINPHTWNPSRVFAHAVVNREDGLIVGVASTLTLEVWDISGTPALRGSLRLPSSLGYLFYESRDICWIITGNGLVGKVNYGGAKPAWEILSTVQDPDPSALGYFGAFDAKRNRLAVLRWLPDAEDGACQCQLEFYHPVYRIAGLTDPVPVTRLRTGDKVRLVAHLYGESGEGASTYPVQGELAEPAAGILLTPINTSEQSGGATFRYQAPDEPATETLALSATVED